MVICPVTLVYVDVPKHFIDGRWIDGIGVIGVPAFLYAKGKVLVAGELWEAESISGSISSGEKIIVSEVQGFRMKVKKAENNDLKISN